MIDDANSKRPAATLDDRDIEQWPIRRVDADAFERNEGDFGLEFDDADAAPEAALMVIDAFDADAVSGLSVAASQPAADAPELSDRELACLLGWPTDASPWGDDGADDDAVRRRNRRSGARHPVTTRATVRRAQGVSGASAEAPETVLLRNVAVGGVSAIHARPMRPGETFWVTLRSPDSRSVPLTVDRRCTVLRCEPGGTGLALFNVAARFVA